MARETAASGDSGINGILVPDVVRTDELQVWFPVERIRYSTTANWTNDGKSFDRTREVDLQAGQASSVDFREAANRIAPQVPARVK